MVINSQERLRRGRYANRIVREGHLYSEIAPERTHGHSTGYMSYGCRCAVCREWNRNQRREYYLRFAYNAQIIKALCAARSAEPATEQRRPPERRHPRTPEPVPPPQRIDELLPAQVSPPPPVTRAVREQITSIAMLELITKAYNEPDWVAPADRKTSEGKPRERRSYQGVEIIVGEHGDVIAFHERDVAEGPPEILQPVKRAMPKAKGTGGGSRGPSTQEALLAELRKAGCDVSQTGSGHIRVTKGEGSLVLPSSASDWRSLKNAVADARKLGLL